MCKNVHNILYDVDCLKYNQRGSLLLHLFGKFLNVKQDVLT